MPKNEAERGLKTKEQLKKLNHRPTKEKGQNFLVDQEVLQDIVNFGAPKGDEKIVEVGPGLGALSDILVSKTENLTLVELEEKFCEHLAGKYPKATIINQDVRFFDFSSVGSDLIVYGNLPYIHSTDIVFHLTTQRASIKRAVLLLQKEFAERMAAEPGSRAFGTLSVGCQVWSKLYLGSIVPPTAFHPKPKVDSRIIAMELVPEGRFGMTEELVPYLRLVLKAAFFKRRKKILNIMEASSMLKKVPIEELLERVLIDKEARAEMISVERWVKLASILQEYHHLLE